MEEARGRRRRKGGRDPTTGAPDSLSETERAATLQALYRRAMTMGDVVGVVFHRLIEPADTSANEEALA